MARYPAPGKLTVEHEHPAGGQRAHRQLGVPGQTELAHHEDIQRRAQRPRDLRAHRHTTARQRQHQHVRSQAA